MENSTMINELGEKLNKEKYACKVCQRKVVLDKAKEEEWFFCIHNESSSTEKELQHYNMENVDYVCNEHYKTLSEGESAKYVEIGYPYFSSLLLSDKSIITY